LAKGTGVTVFRMGIDWSRIMPKEPVNGLKESVSRILTFPIDDEL
jgi:beta-glucosidase/6-phospho-beta-glucosidase/beta-galactosidase